MFHIQRDSHKMFSRVEAMNEEGLRGKLPYPSKVPLIENRLHKESRLAKRRILKPSFS